MENALAIVTSEPNTPALALVPGGRCQVASGQVGEFLGWTGDGWARVALDGEVTISGERRVDEWHAVQVLPVVLLPAP